MQVAALVYIFPSTIVKCKLTNDDANTRKREKENSLFFFHKERNLHYTVSTSYANAADFDTVVFSETLGSTVFCMCLAYKQNIFQYCVTNSSERFHAQEMSDKKVQYLIYKMKEEKMNRIGL